MKFSGVLLCCVLAIAFGVPGMKLEQQSCLDFPYSESNGWTIRPEWPFQQPIIVYCDQDYDRGGWAVIQRRIDGGVEFDRYMNDYVEGFGNLYGEFWLGLDNIYRMTNAAPHELFVWLKDFAGNTSYAKYDQFRVQKVGELYFTLDQCGSYSGTAGNNLCGSGMFRNEYSNGGGLWISQTSNLNGRYVPPNNTNPIAMPGLYWGAFAAGTIKETKMMIRPKNRTAIEFA